MFRREGLESVLENLKNIIAENPEELVCIICYLSSNECSCKNSTTWPIKHLINKLELEIG